MNGTNVPDALERLADQLPELSPQARKAATYVLDHPHDVSVSSVRELAEAASVTPNTMVRMAQAAGYSGYDDFRSSFRDVVRSGVRGFPDRVQWLQEIATSGQTGQLYADMIGGMFRNLEETFSAISVDQMQAAATAIWKARQIFTLGVGVNNANARNFTYLASTGMVQFHAIPRAGNSATDDLAFANSQDALIAITCKPYRSEVVAAVEVAREQGMTIIGVSDSLASPILQAADHTFVVGADAPQFFPSSVSTIALLETLLSFVIASASPEIVSRVEKFHARRHALGIYEKES